MYHTVAIGNGFAMPQIDYDRGQILIGETETPKRSICIGYGADAQDGAIAIGTNTKAKKAEIIIGDINLRELQARLEQLEELAEKQNRIIEKQNDFIWKIWYHPGMPGAQEAEAQFDEDRSQLSTTDNINMATVIGPTPPGTGVICDATATTLS